jgi:hypothetical protein
LKFLAFFSFGTYSNTLYIKNQEFPSIISTILSLSFKLSKTKSAPESLRSSFEYLPVATPILLAPASKPAFISRGVSPKTKISLPSKS